MVAGPGPGRGEPVDPVDTACRALHQAYDCIIMDIEDEGGWHSHIKVLESDPSLSDVERLAAGFQEECEPWTQEYISAYYTDEINELGIYKVVSQECAETLKTLSRQYLVIFKHFSRKCHKMTKFRQKKASRGVAKGSPKGLNHFRS